MNDQLLPLAFRGAQAKLDRADEHLAAIRSEVHAHYYGLPSQVGRVVMDDADHWTFEASLPPMNDRLSVLAGDAIHALRSALDHVAHQLVVLSGGEPKRGGGGTTFPILVNRSANGVQLAGLPATPKTQPIAQFLELAQPYNDPSDFSPLGLLHRLWNRDKHRRLIQGRHRVGDSHLATYFVRDLPASFDLRVAEVMEDEVVLLFGTDHDEATRGEASYWYAFDEIPHCPFTQVLREIRDRVNAVAREAATLVG